MTEAKLDRLLLIVLRLGACLCFFGWTWVHLYWEGPFGVLLWQDNTHAVAEWMGFSWDRFVGTGANDGLVQQLNRGIGWLYLACGVLSLTVRKKSRIQMVCLLGGSVLLILMSYAKFLTARLQLPMFVEHGGQMLMPVILVLALALGVRHRATAITAMVAFVMTFAGHGFYAVGWHWPTPANFVGMTSVILGLGPFGSKVFLQVAGILDFLICIGIFIPLLRRPSALYGAVWGFVTALARPVSGMSLGLNFWGADQYLHEFILRAPHYFIPLYLFFLWKKPQTEEEPESMTESEIAANLPSSH